MGTSLASSESFLRTNQSVNLTEVASTIHVLHDRVCGDKRRVEITRDGCDDVCVLISKRELESLEAALQILADTDAFQEMSRKIQELLATANEVYGLPA